MLEGRLHYLTQAMYRKRKFIVLGLVACFALISAGCKSGGYASSQANKMTAADVHGSARLSTAERKAHIDNCVGQKDRLLSTFSSMTRVSTKSGSNRSVDQLTKYFPPFCDCFVNQLEDRGSKMQLLMSMSAFEQVGLLSLTGSQPDYTPFRTAARRHGMSDGAFRQTQGELRRIQVSAAQLCARHIQKA